MKDGLMETYKKLSSQGLRVLGISYKEGKDLKKMNEFTHEDDN